jgi:uncharacterized Zn finger protein (UPF0148 family)
MIINEKSLLTAGGKIMCPRCQAKSKRTKLQCGRPALKYNSVCGFHGGKSTGPLTAEGKERSRQAHIKSGLYTKESRLRESSASLNLAQLEDMMHVLKMTSAQRARGPKPLNYKRLTSLDDVRDVIGNIETLG